MLVEGSPDLPIKNVRRSIELSRKSSADEVWLLSPTSVESYPGVDRVFSKVPISETPRIYGSCDAIVKLSYVEGMFGPPLEMFHCGGTAIVYDVTGHDEYIRHGYNALVAKTDDEGQVVRYLDELKKDPALLERLKKGAVVTADGWPDWEASSEQFGSALQEIASSPPSITRELLEKKTGFFKEFYEIAQHNEKSLAPLLLKGLIRDPVAHYLYRKHPGLHSLLKRTRDLF